MTVVFGREEYSTAEGKKWGMSQWEMIPEAEVAVEDGNGVELLG